MILENGLPEAVAIPCRAGGVVCNTIAFDAEDISARPLGIRDGKVNEETCNANLSVNLITSLYQRVGYLLLKY